jgi:uncharacterized delta-60 repeat protein
VGVEADGSIIVSGSCATLTGSNTKSNDFAVVKYKPNGTLDTSFSSDGIATVSIGNASDKGTAQFLCSDGKILVGGWSESYIDSKAHYFFSMAKFNVDGSLDSSFGNAGKVSFEPSEVANWYTSNSSYHIGTNLVDVRDMAVLQNGKILVTGSIAENVQLINGLAWIPRHMAVIEFNSDGTVNESFGNSGVVDIAKIGFTESPYSIQIQPDGKIVVGGYGWTAADNSSTANIDFYFARLNTDGSLDTTFNDSGRMAVDFNNNSRDYLFDMKLRSDGVVVATGFTEKNGKDDLAVALIGTNNSDSLTGTNWIDKFYGNGGDDLITGGAGRDYLDGGTGSDTASYADQTNNVIVDLSSENISGYTVVKIGGKDDDTLANIENLVGGAGNDVLTATNSGSSLLGGRGNDILKGGAGDDELIGGAGNDTLNGGGGFNCADYSGQTTNLSINLKIGVATGLNAKGKAAIGTHKLTSIQEACAGSGNDVLTSADTGSQLEGGDGNDILKGGAGKDNLDGGAGTDTADYSDKTDPVLVTLNGSTAATVSVNGVAEDRVVNVENVTCGSGNDTLTGDTNANVLKGGAGNDVITGCTGADTLTGNAGKDTFIFAGGDSGQLTGFDMIADFTKGAVGMGDLIDFSAEITKGGNTNPATTNEASINQITGVATFAAKSGATLSDALLDIATRFTAAGDEAGKFAFFKINAKGDYYLFVSDSNAGVTANDVVVQLVGVQKISSIDLTGGNLTVLS